MKNVLKLLAKAILTKLRSTAAAAAAEKKSIKNYWVETIILTISRKEMDDIMKIVKALE